MAGFAWVTLATNDSYSLGALVLAHSLRRVGSKHDLAVLVTPGVTGAMREKLASVFSLVQEVNVLDSKDEANLALLARPELGVTFTKLHCWRLTQYEKCVFVDADTLVIRNCDELFEREELSAAPDVGWPDCFNSGVFVFKPSQQTFASITAFAATKGSFDGGDQGLLNQYFSDWAHKDISKHLPFIYNMCSTATYSYLPAFKQFGEDVRIIHFIGITKPWLQYFDTVTGQVQPAPGSNHLQPLLQLWWHIFCENVHPQLSPVMASSTLASVWHESNACLPKSYPARTREPDDTYYNDIQSAVPDFSEFRDPWDNYGCETTVNVESSDGHPANDEKTFTHEFSSSRSDDYHHRPIDSQRWDTQRQFDSQNHFASREGHHEHHSHPSVLDDSREHGQTHHEPPFEHRNFTEHQSHQADDQTRNTSHTTCSHGGDDRRTEYCERESSHHRHEENHRSEEIYHNPEYHREQNDHREQIHHKPEYNREQNDHREQIHHKPEYNREQNDHREQIHHKPEYYCEQNDNCEQIHHKHEYHHEQNDHEQINHKDHHEYHQNNQQEYREDRRENREADQQEQRHWEATSEKMHHRPDERSHENCQNRTDDFGANSQPFDRSKTCVSRENTISESDENRLRGRSNVDYREKQTDVRATKTHSTESQSPPAPCSKSQSTATQSEPNIAGQLESNDAGIAGALAKITLGEARSPEQVAFEEHMRKQSWEQGQIDYMGRDSFDNIWKKISETLGVQSQRQPSPPKTLPKPEESEVVVAAPIAAEEPATAKKSEAAVPAEPREKEEQDLTGDLAPGVARVAPQIAQLEPERVIGEAAIAAPSSAVDAAVAPIVPAAAAAVKTPESSEKIDVTSALKPAATALDSSIAQAAEILLRDVQVVEAARSDVPKTPEAAAASGPPAEEKSSSQVSESSPVPIQVAESVVEAEVKESVTEDLRPVTEEAFSSISASPQESVLETTIQVAAAAPPISTPNGAASPDPVSEIGNGIDALSVAAPIAVASAIVAAPVAAIPEETVPAAPQATPEAAPKEETVPAAPLETPEAAPKEETSAVRAASPEKPVASTETPQSAPVAAAAEPAEIKSSVETQSQVSPVEAKPQPEIPVSSAQTSEKLEQPEAPSSEAEKISPAAAEATKEKAELPAKPEEPNCPRVAVPAKSEQQQPIPSPASVKSEEIKVPAKKEESASPVAEKIAPVQPPRTEEAVACPTKPKSSVVAVKAEEKSSSPPTSPVAEKIAPVQPPRTEEAVACPAKPKSPVVAVKAEEKSSSPPTSPIAETKPDSAKKQVPKDEPKEAAATAVTSEAAEESASPSESSEESPVRPARTKEQQQQQQQIIPGTPIVIEATPPTSPPIGAVESFPEQQPTPPPPAKTTKKVVKKIVKKTSTCGEAGKPAEGAEAVEGEAKKVTKKVVKKVTKKTKEDDGAAAPAEASGATEKPKKVVKVLKKTTTTTTAAKPVQTLEADATVPETPPPGPPEASVPVPPKRKLKTVAKSTPAKSESES